MQIELNEQEVQQLIQVLTNSTGMPWVVTHPLIMKISQQQQQQMQPQLQPVQEQRGNSQYGGSDIDPERRTASGLGPAGRDTFTPGSGSDTTH